MIGHKRIKMAGAALLGSCQTGLYPSPALANRDPGGLEQDHPATLARAEATLGPRSGFTVAVLAHGHRTTAEVNLHL